MVGVKVMLVLSVDKEFVPDSYGTSTAVDGILAVNVKDADS